MRGSVLALVAVALGGCTATPPVDSPTPTHSAVRTVAATVTPSPTATSTPHATPAPTGAIPPPTTARPYEAADVLSAMRGSRRPGGVPDQLETTGIATQVAATVWTWQGGPYPALVVGGSCGPASCTLEVSGAPPGAAGADLYAFSVALPSGTVELAASDLHGYPSGLDALIDATVRDRLGPDALDGLALSGATWQLPPRVGWFWVAYRSGGEEGSPGLDVLVNLASGEVVETREP